MDSPPDFFKTILPHNLRDKKMGLPPRFLSEYGNLFSTTVLLKLPNDKESRVGLTKENGRAWLQNGWQEFAEYCGLDVGHFLVFKFDRDLFFNVLIFDKSAFEIKYPCNNKTGIFREFENNDSVEILDEFLKETGETPSIQHIDDLSRRRVRFEEQVFASKEDNKDKFHAERIPFSKGRKKISPIKKFGALGMASSFKSRNPFFKILIQPSHLKFGMYIPVDFAQRYFCMEYGDCNFSIANGRTWLVSYQHTGVRSRVRILCGLTEFLRDNHLKVGDVCVFELIKVEELSFKVSIFLAKKDQDLLIFQGKKSLKREMKASTTNASATKEDKDRLYFHQSPKERDLKLTSSNPYFRIVICPSHVNGKSFLCIPTSFVKIYLKNFDTKHLQEAVLQASDGKKWVARLYPKSQNGNFEIRFSCKTFVVDNNLQAGDVCVFELIKEVKGLFNVFIFQLSKGRNSHHCEELESKLDIFWPMRDPKNEGRSSKALIKSQSCRKLLTENPSFEVSIRPYNFNHGHISLAADFKDFVKKAERVKLVIGDRTWVVKLRRNESRVKLSAGWTAFAKDNALQVDDVCIFELIDEKDSVIKVSIFK